MEFVAIYEEVRKSNHRLNTTRPTSSFLHFCRARFPVFDALQITNTFEGMAKI